MYAYFLDGFLCYTVVVPAVDAAAAAAETITYISNSITTVT